MEEPNAVRPGFLYYLMKGFERIFDVRSNFRETRPDEPWWAADVRALRSDWVVLGRDARIAMAEFERQEAPRLNQGRQEDR